MAAPALDRAVHDLHGPLTVIRGLCLGLERCDRRAERRRTIALIDAEVMRLARGLAGLVAPAAPVAGDPARIERALDNLLHNALRHAGPAGTVTIRVGATNGRAEVRVRDGGRGVPAADREAVFLAGVRGSAPEGEGSGLTPRGDGQRARWPAAGAGGSTRRGRRGRA